MSGLAGRILLAATLALAVSATGAAADSTGVTKDTIKIGVPGPLTGPNASFGAAVYGVAAYYEYVNKQGGVNGRKIEVVLGDTACNEAKGVAVAKKLIHQDQVFLINGGVCSGVALAMRPVIEESGVPWVVSTAANQKISEPVAKNIFHGVQTSRDFGQAMAKFAMSKPDTKKVAFVAHTNEWAKGYQVPATELLKEKGVEVIAEEALERGATDATAQVLSLKQANPDFIIIALYEPELAVFLRDAQKFGLKTPKVGSLGADFVNTEKRLGSKAAMENFYMVHQYRGLVLGKELASFREAIESNLPSGQSLTDFSFYGPGSAVMIVHVLKQLGDNPTREGFIKGMESLKDFDTGVLAGTASYSPENHQGLKDVYVVGYDEQGTLSVFKSWGEKADGTM